MGSQNSIQFIQNPLPKDYKNSIDQPNIYISIVDHNKLQKHTILISSKSQLAHEQQIFIFRRCNSDHIVTAKYFQNIIVNQICANSYQVTYFTECPERRLIDISQFQQAQGYSYLIDCLKGFQILAQKVGWFKITQKMIVFDRDGKIKVWISQNFAQTMVKKTNKILSQKQFLHIIVKIFDSKIHQKIGEQGYYWNLIVNHISKSSKRLTVQQALNALISLASNFLQTARKFINNNNVRQVRQIKQIKNETKNSSSTKTKISAKNYSTMKKISSNINCSPIAFNKQKSLKRCKKLSQQSQTAQSNFESAQLHSNRNTIATIQLHSPACARFTVNNNNGQKIIINHIQPMKRFYSQDSASKSQNSYKAFFINQTNNQLKYNSKHGAFRSHTKQQEKVEHNVNNRKSMDQISYLKKSTGYSQTSMINTNANKASRPTLLVSNCNKNSVTINPNISKFYYQSNKQNINHKEVNSNNCNVINKSILKNSPPPNFTHQECYKMFSSKISKTNFQSIGRKRLTRKKYEGFPQDNNPVSYFEEKKEINQKNSQFNKHLNQKENNIQLNQENTLKTFKNNGWFKKQIDNNETIRYYDKNQKQSYLNLHNQKVIKKHQNNEKIQKQIHQNLCQQSFQKKMPLDQLHTIKSIVYSQANISQALSLELLDNGLSRQFLNRLQLQQYN